MEKRIVSSGKVLFVKSSDESHSNLDVLTFDPKINLYWTEMLADYIGRSSIKTDRLAENYQGLDFKKFIAVTVLLDEGKIKGFSTVWNRSFYPSDTVRIFNRWWEDKRKVTKTICGAHTVSTMEQQLHFARLNGYKWAFFSRDRSPRVIEEISAQLTEKTDRKWTYCRKKIAVCYPSAASCWQWVGYHQISGEKDKWEMLDE